AAAGISVTNFKRGGRLATITGNLIRNLKRREFEPVDKRGVGISVEADGVVSNNVIENAPSCGLALGWGDYRRDIIAAQNIIRNAKIGVLVSSGSGLGPALITGNLITGSQDGAIRTAKLSVPHGPDLAKTAPTSGNITVSQNVTG
nr:TIGR03808 family TAT-translocated repetitive protein [Alphaproteobacteria bacterium]